MVGLATPMDVVLLMFVYLSAIFLLPLSLKPLDVPHEVP